MSDVTVFKDRDFHGEQSKAFLDWKEEHPSGFYLNWDEKAPPMLHTAKCWHFCKLGDKSNTKNLKACANTSSDLIKWAKERRVVESYCKDCKP